MEELLLVIYSLFPAVVTLPTGDHFLSGESVPTTEPTVVKEMIIHPLKNRKSGANFLRYTCLPHLQAASIDKLLVIFWTDGRLKKVVFFPLSSISTSAAHKGQALCLSPAQRSVKKKWKWEPFPFPTKYKHDSRLHYEGSRHGKRPSVQVREQNTRLSCRSQAERRPLNNKYFSKPVQLWALAASSNRWRD